MDQIRTVQVELGWSTQQLLDKSGLTLDRSTLHRKLHGEVPTSDAEIEALASAIQYARPTFRIEWPTPRAAVTKGARG